MGQVRLIVLDATGSRRLEADGSAPSLTMPGGQHADPAAIIAEARRQLGLEAAFVRVVDRNTVEVECLRLDDASPLGGVWCPHDLSPPLEKRPPWQRPGWLAEVMPSVDAELERAGLARTGPPRQIRHINVTGMLEIPTDGRFVWLKAVPPLFAHEGPLVEWLSRLDLTVMPSVLAHTSDWWISAPFPEASMNCKEDFILTLADLQVGTFERVAEIRSLGCPDRPVGGLADCLAHISTRPDLLGRADRTTLGATLPALERVCSHVDGLGFPPSLVHGDLHAENVWCTARGWLLFDWTDACVAHPFVDLALPLLDPGAKPQDERARDFGAVWARVVGEREVDSALRAAPVIGAAHQAESYRMITDGIECSGGDEEASRDELVGLLRFWVRSLVVALEARLSAGWRS